MSSNCVTNPVSWLPMLMILLSSTLCLSQTETLQDLGSQPASFSLISQRDPLLTLRAPMRFHIGDDPTWSEPNFDDSAWLLERADRNWKALGFSNLSGLAWYRFQVVLPQGDDAYALRLPQIRTAYELFIDGKLSAAAGSMPPHARMYASIPVIVELHKALRTAPTILHIALRVWQDPVWAAYNPGGPQGAMVVGEHALLMDVFNHERLDRYWRNSDWFDLAVLELLGSGAALALFILGRNQQEYLWFCLLCLGCSSNHTISLWARLHPHPVHRFESIESVFYTAYFVASLQFYRTFFSGKLTTAFRVGLLCCFLWFVNTQAAPLQSFSARFENAGELLFTLPIYGWILFFIAARVRQGRPDAHLLIVPVAMLFGTCLYRQSLFTISTFGHPEVMKYAPIFKGFFYGDLQDIAEAFFLIAMLIILGQRFSRTRRQSDRTAAELEAARSVQRVLVPERSPHVPGMEIVTAYYPAQEVGGDFYQILPLKAGGTLVVIGDVAGKGVPAALTVSLIVGVLRTLVDFVTGPGEVLAGLNQRLHGRESAFATCLVMQFSAKCDHLTIANAGHLPPFVDETELSVETGLPLGLSFDTAYTQSFHFLKPGARIVVMTDGIPEAMCKRELFGFERTRNIIGERARSIADIARNFGQVDDITVMSIDITSPSVKTSDAEQISQNLAMPAFS